MINSTKGMSAARTDLLAALSRLIARKPKDIALRARAAAGSKLISIVSVCLEAHRSRTLIGHANCALPDVREKVLVAKANENRPRVASQRQEILALKGIRRNLTAQLQQKDNVNARLMLEVERLERDLATERRKSQRTERHASQGNVVDFRAARSKAKRKR